MSKLVVIIYINYYCYIVRVLDADFIADTSFPDNSIIHYGKCFDKSWVIENTGSKVWRHVKLVHQDGFQPFESEIEVPDAKPGEQVKSSVPFVYILTLTSSPG